MSYFQHSGELPAWIGNPPAGWGTDWLKWHVRLLTERPTDEEAEELPYIANEDISSWTGKLLNPDPQPADSDSRKFQPDDILFNKLRPYLAKVYHASFAGVSSGELLCLRGDDRVLPRYLFYVVSSKAFVDAINAETFGSKMPRADWETVGHQPLPLPAIETQKRIVSFLDEKTAQINGLIEKKRKMLIRLSEKRQAIITQTVAKGLNPAAPMRNSGIDWLGPIPAHWKKGNIRRFASMKTGHTPSRNEPEYWEDCTVPWFTLSDVWQLRDGTRIYIEDTAEKISMLGLANSAAELLPAGTVIFSRTASIGFSGIMPCPMATTQDFWNWICGPKLIPEYLLFLFRAMTQKFAEITNGSTHKTIYQPIAAGLEICVPPIHEQEKIARMVKQSMTDVDAVHAKVSTSIEQLTEYRSALITAAVTGQIEELR